MAACLVAMLAACEKKYSERQLVESFLDSNLVDKATGEVQYSELDSTSHIGDSLIVQMRAATAKSAAFKPGLKYSERKGSRTLHYITARYQTGSGKRMKQTFYMDRQHTGIVCVKTNVPDSIR